MARHASIRMSQVAQYGRMDAEFHIAIASIADGLKEFQGKGISPDACKSQLRSLPLYALEPLKPLRRGATPWTHMAALELIDKYPLESWLLVAKHISKAHDKLAEDEKQIERDRLAIRRFLGAGL